MDRSKNDQLSRNDLGYDFIKSIHKRNGENIYSNDSLINFVINIIKVDQMSNWFFIKKMI